MIARRANSLADAHRIGISCIGSGVGQSVIASLRRSALPLQAIGLGTNPFAFGLHDCDAYAYTPSIYEERYVERLIETCLEHRVHLVIPGHDDEVLLYARHADAFGQAGILAMHSAEPLVALCRDKVRLCRELRHVVDAFVQAFAPGEVEEAIARGTLRFPFIAKPRSGNASRGVEVILAADDLPRINAGHVVQELALPARGDPNRSLCMRQLEKRINPQLSEISIQLVVGLDGELIGRMCTWNRLDRGVPIEIVPLDDPHVWEVVDRLLPVFLDLGLRGPLNLQGRITDAGLKIFELNPRFTGITGLRAMMGFNEVEACVKEWLGIDRGRNMLRHNPRKFGVRQIRNKVIPLERNAEVRELHDQISPVAAPVARTVVLTGSTGYLGRQLARQILGEGNGFSLETLREPLDNPA